MSGRSPLVFLPFSGVYSAVTRARLQAYRRGWFSVSQLDAPVISVGNLTVGGTGKTPMVDWVCKAVGDNRRVCVLTRGYGRENRQSQVVVSDGTQLLAEERVAGDEPFLLAKKLIGTAAVIANPDRVAAGEWAKKHLNTDVFVLDDGFQHLQIARDLDIVTVDATNPFGNGRLLPYGRLREPIDSLSRASCVVLTRTEQAKDWTTVKTAIEQVASKVPIFSSKMITASVQRLNNELNDSGSPVPETLGAFCGVGNPDSFFNHLRREGHTLSFTRAFPDHHRYNQADIDRLVAEVKSVGCAALITTAKDATKLDSLKFDIDCYVLDIRIAIDDEDQLIKLIQDACKAKNNSR